MLHLISQRHTTHQSLKILADTKKGNRTITAPPKPQLVSLPSFSHFSRPGVRNYSVCHSRGETEEACFSAITRLRLSGPCYSPVSTALSVCVIIATLSWIPCLVRLPHSDSIARTSYIHASHSVPVLRDTPADIFFHILQSEYIYLLRAGWLRYLHILLSALPLPLKSTRSALWVQRRRQLCLGYLVLHPSVSPVRGRHCPAGQRPVFYHLLILEPLKRR